MKGYNLWSYRPYKPLLAELGEIYICRVVPYIDRIHFEWLACNSEMYSVYYRERGEEQYICLGSTRETEYDILNLKPYTDYEFYVRADDKKSSVRLARCGESVGTVVNYLHPKDEAYAFSGHYLCSPSVVRHPDGFLLASMDLFTGNYPQNLTLIFRSDDDGENWHYVSELMPCFWGKMFIHRGELYMLACSTEYGDLLIGKSTDGGKTFSAPVTLLRGSNGKNGNDGVHKNPQNIVRYKGRIYETLEWGTWSNKQYGHAAMVMSCSEDDDLLVPENWSFTYPKKFNPSEAEELGKLSEDTMTIEGTLVVSPDDELLNIMRFGKNGNAIVYCVDVNNPEAELTYLRCMEFNANKSKFMIKYDSQSGMYFTIADYLFDEHKQNARNYLVLMASRDLKKWDIVCDLLDFRAEDSDKVGFQYVDFEIENEDIIFLCRTAINNACNFHDANYSTFHRIPNFRNLIKE